MGNDPRSQLDLLQAQCAAGLGAVRVPERHQHRVARFEVATVVIDQVFSEFDTWQAELPEGAVAGLSEEDRPAGAARAARLEVETAARLVQATIWDSGEVDFVVGDLAPGGVLINEHRQVTSPLGVRELLADVREAIDS
jgi:hypothetical protein